MMQRAIGACSPVLSGCDAAELAKFPSHVGLICVSEGGGNVGQIPVVSSGQCARDTVEALDAVVMLRCQTDGGAKQRDEAPRAVSGPTLHRCDSNRRAPR